MIDITYNNAGDPILIRVDGKAYTEEALREHLELALWAKKRRESNRLASARYEARNHAQRNAVRAKRAQEGRSAAIVAENGAQTVT